MKTENIVPLKAQGEEPANEPISIAKPSGFDINRFKSKRSGSGSRVDDLQKVFPVHRASDAKDFVRLHPDEDEYWSDELCFVNVPIKGQPRDTLHLIAHDLADLLPKGKVLYYQLALATKPHDAFFLCQVPTRNLVDSLWNSTNRSGCEEAKEFWLQLVSLREEGTEGYKPIRALSQNAFPEPRWPAGGIYALIETTFTGRVIDREDHPCMLRLLGGEQVIG